MIAPRSIAAAKSGTAAGEPPGALLLLDAWLEEDVEPSPDATLVELDCEALLDEFAFEELETIELLEMLDDEFPPAGLARAAGIAESDDAPQDAAMIATRSIPTINKGMRCTVSPPWDLVPHILRRKKHAVRDCGRHS